ncbi:hypothetical protein TNCV_2311471 [Trichonephila clavipes]|nr:hypothetical protein TNCV_2311471 [Trichonephila clavipes]
MHLSATPRWSDSSVETPLREDAEQLRYAPPHWSYTGIMDLATAKFQQDNARPHVARIVQRFLVNYHIEFVMYLPFEVHPSKYQLGLLAFLLHISFLGFGWKRVAINSCPKNPKDLLKEKTRKTSQIASLAVSLSGSFADRKHVVHGCSTIDPDYTPSCATPDQLWQRVEAAWSALPQEHILSLFQRFLKWSI